MLPFVRVNIGTENLADQLPPAVRALRIDFTDPAMVCKLACGLARLKCLETVGVANREAAAMSMVLSHCQAIRRLEIVPFEGMCNAPYPRTLRELVLHEGYGCGWRAETARRLFERTAIERVVSLSGPYCTGLRSPALDRLRARASVDESETAYSRESDGSIMVRVTGDRSVSSLQWDKWAENGVSNVVLVSCFLRDFEQSAFGGQSSIRRIQITHPWARYGFSGDGQFIAVLGNVGMWDVTWEPSDGPRLSVSCEHPLEEFERILAAGAASSDDDHESDGGSGTGADSSWDEENDTSEEEEEEEEGEQEEVVEEAASPATSVAKGGASADGADGEDGDDADGSSADDSDGKAGAADGGDEESDDEDGDSTWATVDREWKEAN